MLTTENPSPPAEQILEEPAWDIARLFPMQGYWTESEYLDLTSRTKWLVEYTHGRIEVLPMPKTKHQRILRFLLDVLRAFVGPQKLGEVLFTPLRVRTSPGKFREPDLIFMFASNASRAGEDFWEGADLVMEVVSADDPKRDHVEKRVDYAEAHIPEYWIVDPQLETVTVLTLEGEAYRTHGEFRSGDRATSVLLDGFSVDVETVFRQPA